MKCLAFTVLLLFVWSLNSLGQSVAINSDGSQPHTSSMLDIKNSSKGILIPRTSTTTRMAIVNPAKGLMLYDTTTSSFWFYNGSSWNENSISKNVWGLKGNSGTNAINDFIGTTDAVPLRFRMNNIKAGLIDSASSNTSIGFKTLNSITGGTLNTALGFKSLMGSANGLRNTAVGAYSLFVDTSGDENTAIGAYTLYSNNGGVSNTALGHAALNSNVQGSRNAAIGGSTMIYNVLGASNTAVGYASLYYNNSGHYNTAIGTDAMTSNFSGDLNTAVGTAALYYNVTGTQNISIGWNSGVDITRPDLNNTINIGNHGWANGFHNQVLIGNQSSGWIGGWVPWTNASDERGKKNISEEVKGLDFIMRLRPVAYNVDVKSMIALSGNRKQKISPASTILNRPGKPVFLLRKLKERLWNRDFNLAE